MDKPITIKTKEFSEQIIQLVNTSELPAFIMSNIFSNLASTMSEIAYQQEENDKKQWEEYLKNKESDNG